MKLLKSLGEIIDPSQWPDFTLLQKQVHKPGSSLYYQGQFFFFLIYNTEVLLTIQDSSAVFFNAVWQYATSHTLTSEH